MLKVLITGASGYMGTALTRVLHKEDCRVVTVDSGMREAWVTHCEGNSLTRFKPIILDFKVDLALYSVALRLLEVTRPDVIVHLASQPSAPYSEISPYNRAWTQTNNLQMMLNLLCASHELKLDPEFIVTTTTGIPGAPNGPISEDHMPNLAGSSYHVSRGFDSANMSLAARQWGSRILEMRTSIVYGSRVDGIDYPVTRLDWDFYFGTVIHRFLVRKMMKKPITVYGAGLQKKPIISLRDAIKSIVMAIDLGVKEGHRIVNQVTECIEVGNMAEIVGGQIEHIANPRVEKEDHKMVIINEEFQKYLPNGKFTTLGEEIPSLEEDMLPELLPVGWEDIFNGRRPLKRL